MTTRRPPSRNNSKSTIDVDGRSLPVSNLEKVLWPRDGLTKGDLIAYYRTVSSFLLPYVKGRPLTLERYPDGIDKFNWWEKQVPRGLPDWVHTVVTEPSTRTERLEFILCDDEPTLVYVANLAGIVLHVWFSHVPTLDTPDFLLIDLDPTEGCTLASLARVALTVRDELASLGIAPLVKTTGGSGLHAVIPLQARYDWELAKQFSELIARRINAVLPSETTLLRNPGRRPKGTVYLDYVQVGKGKTYIAPFSVRARDGAPVSMPIDWSEVEVMRRKRAPETAPAMLRWNIGNVPKLLAAEGDPWREAWKPHRIERALEKARSLWGAG